MTTKFIKKTVPYFTVPSWLQRWRMVQQFLWVLSAVFGRRLRNLRDAHVITMAPVDGEARMVKSKSKPCWPHIVQVLSGGEVVCDENCGHRSRFAHIARLLHTLWAVSVILPFQHLKPNLTNITTQQVRRDVGKIHVSAMLQNQTTWTNTLTATTFRAYQRQTNSHTTYYHMNASCI